MTVFALVMRNLRAALVLAFACGPLNEFATAAAKALVNRPRPATMLVGAPSTSFPSGHALEAMAALLAVLCFFFPMMNRLIRRIAVAVVAASLLTVGISRVALNVHYPSDVLAGWSLGYLYFLLCLLIFRPSIKPGRQPGARDRNRCRVLTTLSRWTFGHDAVTQLGLKLYLTPKMCPFDDGVHAPTAHITVRRGVRNLRLGGAGADQCRRRRSLVRERGWQCDTGGFGGEHRRFQRDHGDLPARRHRLAVAAVRHSRPTSARRGWRRRPRAVFRPPRWVSTASTPRSAPRPNPGTGLPYTQVSGPNYWWSGDDHSPTFNCMQVCQKSQCPFNTGDSENLQIPQYKHAVVMGVNKNKTPGGGAAFFFHTTDGRPTEGCVAVDDAQLVSIMKWLRPGAVIAITK